MTFIKRKEVCRKTGLSYSSIQRYEKKGSFPSRRRLSDFRIAWIESEVDEWISSRKRANIGGAN